LANGNSSIRRALRGELHGAQISVMPHGHSWMRLTANKLGPGGAAVCSHGWNDAQRSAGIAEPVVSVLIDLFRPESAKEFFACDW